MAGRNVFPQLFDRFRDVVSQSMRHGARLGPTLALWCARQPLSYLVAGSGKKDPRESKISPFRSLGSNVFPRGHSSRVCAYLNSKVTNLQFCILKQCPTSISWRRHRDVGCSSSCHPLSLRLGWFDAACVILF